MRDIFISFLGTGKYDKTKYLVDDRGKFIESRYIQEAVCEKINKENLKVYICLTEKARESNWQGKYYNYARDELVAYGDPSLEEIFNEKQIDYELIDIRDGQSEDEIWENFDLISNLFEEGDRVYLDITHSFRSIPIMMMSILNYVKFTKNIEVKNIFYGAYEAKDKDNNAPIFDLTLFDTITDWTMSVEELISSGNSKRLNKIIRKTKGQIYRESSGCKKVAESMEKIGDGLVSFTENIYTVRALNIGENTKELKKNLETIDFGEDYKFKPFEKIMDELELMFEGFSDSVVENLLEISKLCYNFKLIQQGYTFMEENITNFLIELYLARENLEENIKDLDLRSDIDKVLLSKAKEKRKYKGKKYCLDTIDKAIGKYLDEDLANMAVEIKGIRNDLNHGGINDGPVKIKTSLDKLKEFINSFESLVIDEFYKNGKILEIDRYWLEEKDKEPGLEKIGLVFSHKLTEDQLIDIRENLALEEILAMPEDLQKLWSHVPADLDDLEAYLEPISQWIQDNFKPGDYLLVQGDFGASYSMVALAKSLDLIPIYSTTERIAKEYRQENGNIRLEHIFKHRKFRKY